MSLRDLLGLSPSPRRTARPFTTFQLGGAADWYADVCTADELAAATQTAREHDIPFFLLGTGANVIVDDHGFRELVVHNRAQDITLDPAAHRLHAESGAIMYPDVIERSVTADLSDMKHHKRYFLRYRCELPTCE